MRVRVAARAGVNAAGDGFSGAGRVDTCEVAGSRAGGEGVQLRGLRAS